MGEGSIQDIIKARKNSMIPSRLAKGAAVLGRLWQEGVRCRAEWSGLCVCAQPNDFCMAKLKWLDLLKELHGGKYPYDLSGNEGFLVLESMTVRMFNATGLTIKVARPGERALLRIGPRGTDFDTLIGLSEIPEGLEREAAVESVIKIMEVFGAR